METVVELRGVCKIYGSGATSVRALSEASLKIRKGEVLVIEGPSGSGKTTLLSILGLLLRPSHGEVIIGGRDITKLSEIELPDVRARMFGFIFQGFNLFPALTALENVALALQIKKPNAKNNHDEARRLLEVVGLKERMHHLPADLSGGQKQRVAIARALGGNPPVILGDEPTAALDSKTALGTMDLLRSLAVKEGRAVVVVTHDPRLSRYADRMVRVEDGKAAEIPVRPAEGAGASLHVAAPKIVVVPEQLAATRPDKPRPVIPPPPPKPVVILPPSPEQEAVTRPDTPRRLSQPPSARPVTTLRSATLAPASPATPATSDASISVELEGLPPAPPVSAKGAFAAPSQPAPSAGPALLSRTDVSPRSVAPQTAPLPRPNPVPRPAPPRWTQGKRPSSSPPPSGTVQPTPLPRPAPVPHPEPPPTSWSQARMGTMPEADMFPLPQDSAFTTDREVVVS